MTTMPIRVARHAGVLERRLRDLFAEYVTTLARSKRDHVERYHAALWAVGFALVELGALSQLISGDEEDVAWDHFEHAVLTRLAQHHETGSAQEALLKVREALSEASRAARRRAHKKGPRRD